MSLKTCSAVYKSIYFLFVWTFVTCECYCFSQLFFLILLLFLSPAFFSSPSCSSFPIIPLPFSTSTFLSSSLLPSTPSCSSSGYNENSLTFPNPNQSLIVTALLYHCNFCWKLLRNVWVCKKYYVSLCKFYFPKNGFAVQKWCTYTACSKLLTLKNS